MAKEIENTAEEAQESFLLEGIQQAYWVGQSGALELGIPARYYVEVDLACHDHHAVERALNALIERHKMLRAIISENGEQHILQNVPTYRLDCTNLENCSPAETEARLRKLRETMKMQELASDSWPQFDIRATKQENGLRLHLSIALWMMDGWSFHILIQELAALTADPSASLPPLEMRFSDYLKDRHGEEAVSRRQEAWSYWRARLDTFPGPPSLPLSPRLEQGQRPSFRHLVHKLPPHLWDRIARIATSRRITPSLLACAAYTEVLSRFSGSRHFAITLLYSGRFQHLPQADRVFGNFGTTILLEVDAAADKSFMERARALQMQFWRDSEHIEVSGIDVTRALQQRSGSGASIGIPVTFTAVSAPADTLAGAHPAKVHHETARLEVPQVHLDHQLHFEPDGTAVFNWDYVVEMFPAGFIETVSEAHFELINALAGDEACWDLPDPTAGTSRDPDPATSISPEAPQRLEAMFDRQAIAAPDRTAIISPAGSITYAKLREKALALSAELVHRGVAPGMLVAVTLRKGWEQVAAVLGILYAGAAYVPVDPDLPDERRALLLKSSGARHAVTSEALYTKLDWPETVEPIRIDRLPVHQKNVRQPSGEATDLAYVIFTSGSTGTPKGVMIDHQGAWNTIADLNQRFALTPRDKVLALSSLSFDLSVYDIFGTLAAGATIVMPAPDSMRDPAHWRALVCAHQVSVWNSVPALMQLAVEGTTGPVLEPLRLVMLSGDWIPLTLPDQVRIAAPCSQIHSLGGATEASIWSVLYPIDRIEPEWRSIPYGHAMKNQSIHVLDENLQLCPPWVPGELYIGGIGVALGYLNDRTKTEASFIRHPRTGERLYRTGDLGRYLSDGEIEFLGRADFQVKIQGYRVECAEVEAALLSDPEINGAIVSAASDSRGTRHLVAYIVPTDGRSEPDIPSLSNRLRAILPAYMVPTYFKVLEKLPLSDNGKVVRSALPAPDFGASMQETRAYDPPREGAEAEIAAMWRDVLDNTGPIGRDDNFFTLGGSSFAGMRLMARMEKRFGKPVSFAMLASHPTIAGLSQAISADDQGQTEALLVTIRKGDPDETPLFCIHPIGGNVMCYLALARSMPDERPIYGLRAPGLSSRSETPLCSIPKMADHYLAEIRKIQPHGPYHLAGWSLGGLVAQEMARVLLSQGATLGTVAMIDSAVPRSKPTGPGHQRRFLHFARDIEAIAGVGPNDWSEEQISLPLNERMKLLAARLETAGVPIEASGLDDIYRVFDAGSTALEDHVPSTMASRLLLFAAARRPDLERVKQEWRALAPEIEIVELDADHYSIMQPPSSETIGLQLCNDMARIDCGKRPPGEMKAPRPRPKDGRASSITVGSR